MIVALLVPCCASVDQASAQSSFRNLINFRRVDADPEKDYALTEEHGPWLVMATALTEEERRELRHNMMWGSSGYPVEKFASGGWHLPHYPTVFPTKRAAVKQWERYIDMLLDKQSGRI